jgi:hypothetical protein
MKSITILITMLLSSLESFSQNTKTIDSPSGTVISNAGGGDIPNSSTILEIRSTDKGILIPRMTSTEREAILRPPTGLLVFDSTTDKFWFYNGQAWSKVAADNNVRFGFDLVKTSTLTSTYDLSYTGNYNFDPTSVTLTNATTLHLQRAGLYRFGLLGIKHLESAASASASSATFNLYLTVNTKQYNVIANGVQAGGALLGVLALVLL